MTTHAPLCGWSAADFGASLAASGASPRPRPRFFTDPPPRVRRRAGCRARTRPPSRPGRLDHGREDHRAGHDRRRPLAASARAPAVAARAGSAASSPSSRSTAAAGSRWPSITSGISHSSPMSIVASVVTVPATPTSSRAAVVSRDGSAAAASARSALDLAPRSADRCAGGAPRGARSRCRGWPGRAPRQARPRTSSVEPPPMSQISAPVAHRRSRADAAVGQLRLLVTGQQPGHEAVPGRHAGQEPGAVPGIADGARRDREHRLRPERGRARRISLEDGVDARASPRRPACARRRRGRPGG